MTVAPPSRRALAALAGLVIVVGVVYAATRREGLAIGSDATLFLLHARNVAEGVPYAQTGYVYHALRPDHSPPAYPPLVPVVLAPGYALFGLHAEPLKLFLLPFFLGFLVALWGFTRRRVGDGAAFAIVVLAAAMPFFWRLKDDLVAEFPLLCFTYLALWYAERLNEPPAGRKELLRRGLVLGLFLYLACATKTVAIVMLPSLVIAHALRERRLLPRLDVALACGTCLALVAIQSQVLVRPPTYAGHAATFSSETLLSNLRLYQWELTNLWFSAWPRRLALALTAGVTAVATLGWAHAMRRHTGLAEAFAVVHTVVVVAFPGHQGFRYLVPVMPLLLFYLIEGARTLARPMRVPPAFAVALVAVLLLASFGRHYARSNLGPLSTGLDRPETVALARAVQAQTDSSSVIITVMPRTIALIARRKAAMYPQHLNDIEQWRFLDSLGATHALVASRESDDNYLERFVRRNPERLDSVWGSERFVLYRMRRGGRKPHSGAISSP